jgi:copper resistance protein C
MNNEFVSRSRGVLLGLLFYIFLNNTPSAWSHSFPDHSDPRVGWELKNSPTEVKIWFDVAIEPLFSTIEVFDSNHIKVDKGDSHVDPNNSLLLIVSVPQLPKGRYEVHWSVISIDTHHTEGTFKFSIGE